MAATGTPLILVLLNGGAVAIEDVLDDVDAVVEAFYPGKVGAAAIADLLFGVFSPSGKMPYTVFPAAYADETSELQARDDAGLAEVPGGSQTAPNEVTWEDGAVILTLAADEGLITTMAVGSCATGYYCAYSGYNLSGSKLSFSACNTTQSTGALSVVRSLANARSSGYVQGKNSSGTVLATVSAGGSLAYASTSITKLTCVS